MSVSTPSAIPIAQPDAPSQVAARASLLLVSLLWGLNWPSGKFVLHDFSPWAFRTICFSGSALLLVAIARWQGISLRIEPGWARLHVVVAGFLNVACFGVLIAFGQLGAMTSRVAICAYTMPLWAALLARPILGERLDRKRGIALAFGAGGLGLLLAPLTAGGLPVGIVFALGAGFCWALGTVYLKWAQVRADPIALTVWQLVCGAVAVFAGLLIAGLKPPAPVHLLSVAALAYTTVLGTGLGYLLWFRSAARLPATTAGLGSLLVPVVGVLSSALLIGDRPSATDLGGFALISVAAVFTLIPRRAYAAVQPP